MRGIGLVCVGTSVVTALELQADYSKFSGLVSEVQLGGQPVRVSIDLLSSESMIFGDCPPFVRTCYRVPETLSGDSITVVHPYGVFEGVIASDRFHIGNDESELDLSFALMHTITPRTVQMREVAGVIGLGNGSPLLSYGVVSLTESGSGQVVISDEAFDHDRLIWTPLAGSGDALRFSGQFVVSNGTSSVESETGEILFDPTLDHIQLPMIWRGHFLARLHELVGSSDLAGQIVVPCTNAEARIAETLAVSLRLRSGELVPLDISQLRGGSGKTFFTSGPVWRTCPLRIRFHDATNVVVGRALLRSVERLALDLNERRIGFEVPFSPRNLPPAIQPDSLIPIVSFKGVSTTETGAAVTFGPTKPSAPGFVLVSASPLPWVSGWTCFNFLTVARTGLRGTIAVPGDFADMRISEINDEGGFRIEFFQTQTAGAHPLDGGIFARFPELSVCSRPRPLDPTPKEPPIDSIADLALPPVDPMGSDNECAVCLGEHVGIFQRLPACNHKFHLDCIRSWLERQHLHCPVCRTGVKRKLVNPTLTQ